MSHKRSSEAVSTVRAKTSPNSGDMAEGTELESLHLDLFAGDPFNRLLATIHLGARGRSKALLRVLVAIGSTWVLLAVLAWIGDVALRLEARESFLRDVAAYAQFLIAIPLLIAAEPYVRHHTSMLGEYLSRARILPDHCGQQLATTINRIGTAQRSPASDGICIVAAYIATWAWLMGELTNGVSTWHALLAGKTEHLTLPGLWAGLFAVPLLNYLLFRWIWKVFLWCWFLRSVSRLTLSVVPTHPDGAGGLGIIGDIQARFGILIFAVGIMVAATVQHKLAVEHARIADFAVWGVIAEFVVLAPPVFLAPLLFFTRTLALTKRAARIEYDARIAQYGKDVDRKWRTDDIPYDAENLAADFAGLADARHVYELVDRMRIVAFDLASAARLAISAGGPFVPIVLHFLPLPAPIRSLLEAVK